MQLIRLKANKKILCCLVTTGGNYLDAKQVSLREFFVGLGISSSITKCKNRFKAVEIKTKYTTTYGHLVLLEVRHCISPFVAFFQFCFGLDALFTLFF